MQCPQCRQENSPRAKFCEACGSSLAAQACAKCGAALSPTARFCPECGQAAQVVPEAAPVAPERRPAPAPEAERRQLTVVFCDLVGSTALSTRLDPEELREVVRGYQAVCAEMITRFDGHIAQYLGDGLLVYFGYPQAHEDDAQRAVRAGLGIVEAVGHVSAGTDQPLAVRVGIHTGPVVVGQVGGGGRHEQLALGETPNVAARLQALAEPDRVVISAATHRLVDGFFRCRELGPQSLKGVSETVRTFEVVEEGPARSRLDLATLAGLTPLVGREQELGLLLDRWERACEGHGQVVLLTGEPGIGKSRLVQVLKERAADAPHRRLEARCSPYYEHTPLYPVIDLLPRVFGWSRDAASDAKLAKLERGLEEAGVTLAETVPLLASLLSLPASDRYRLPPMSPERQKQKTLETVLRFLLAGATGQPVLLIVEDLHWVDPTTLELLTLLLDQVPTARLLVLLTARPSFTVPWPTRSHLNTLTLGRFTGTQTEAFVSRVAGGKTLPVEVLQQIVAKTDGVPLFVEELTKMVLESGLLRASGDRYELTAPLPPLAIPTTLQDSLMARLDRLAAVKEVAQLGATLGRAFPFTLIRAVAALDELTLQRELGRLVEAELLYQRGVPPEATYVFKHALIQDAAYQALLKSTRQQYHQRVARAMVEHFPEEAATRPEFVAHHYSGAGLTAEAVTYWQRAGVRASERSAYVEAAAHLTKGLEEVTALPDAAERAQYELTLRLALGDALAVVKGYAAPEAGQAYKQAYAVCQQLRDPPQLFSALFNLWRFHLMRADLQTTRELAEQLVEVAEHQQQPLLLMQAHFASGTTLFWLGHSVAAHDHLTQTLNVCPSQPGSTWPDVVGTRVASLVYVAWSLWVLGYATQALHRSTEAARLAEELPHLFTRAFAQASAAYVDQLRRDSQATQEATQALIVFTTEQGFPQWLAAGMVLRGWALAVQGRIESGIGQIHDGMKAWKRTGSELMMPYFLSLLADAHRHAGQIERGVQTVDEALARMEKTGERSFVAELHRLHGELVLAGTPTDAAGAEADFTRAIGTAREQQAKSWELRASTSLARLWGRQGKRAEARQLLSGVYGWFTEGFDTPDLKDAKALLDELA